MNSKFFDNSVMIIIFILIILVVGGTIYFALDIFGIIEVPEQYSIAGFFNEKIDVMVTEGHELTDEEVQNLVRVTNRIKDNTIVTNADYSVTGDDIINKLKTPNSVTQEQVAQEQTQEQTGSNNFVSVRYFYYNQLDEYGKIIYDGLYSCSEQMKTGTFTADFGDQFNALLHEEYGSDVLNNSFQLAINALTFDNPQFFYIDVTKIYLSTYTYTKAFEKTYLIKVGASNGVSYLSDEFNSKELVDSAVVRIENIRDEVCQAALGKKTKEEQIKYIHDYLVDHLEYEDQGDNTNNIYGALINNKTVCEGYARGFKYMLDKLSIPCLIVCGIGQNSSGETEAHAWNYVQLYGNWYAVDCTWDDPVIIGGYLTDKDRYEYFLKGSQVFFKEHTEDGKMVGNSKFAYPTLSVNNF